MSKESIDTNLEVLPNTLREFLLRNGVGKTCVWKKYILLYECIQRQGKKFLKSYIGLLSCHLTSTGRPAHLAGINGAV